MRIISLLLLIFIYTNTNAQLKRILVKETTVKINPKDSAVFYFGFNKGDKILISTEMKKGKKLRQIEFFEYPDIPIFMEYKSKNLQGKTLKIQNLGIYKLKFTNQSIFSRIFNLKIERVARDKNIDFNTSVYWKNISDTIFNIIEKEIEIKKYEVQTIIPLSAFYLNSSSAAVLGRKSRISFPVKLPENTIEWYYQFSAAKNNETLERLNNLTKQLSGILSDTKTIDINTDDLLQPQGKTYCDIYLMNRQNSNLFEHKRAYQYIPEGSRKNIKSGIVKLNVQNIHDYYIAIRNPEIFRGIQVNFEAVAIVETIQKKYEKVKDPNHFKVHTKKIPYLKIQHQDSK